MTHPKPKYGQPCNGCGYCCNTEPCGLAREYLGCHTGACVALEVTDGRSGCGLVRNPLGYLWLRAKPGESKAILYDAKLIERGTELSAEIATALGIGRGCDSVDDDQSTSWPHIIATSSMVVQA